MAYGCYEEVANRSGKIIWISAGFNSPQDVKFDRNERPVIERLAASTPREVADNILFI